MHSFSKYVPLSLYVIAALSGAFLTFGSTNASLFEWLMIGVALGTGIYAMMKGTSWRELLSLQQNKVLLLFTALICIQYSFADYVDPLFGFITVYLIGVYALVQFWSHRNLSIAEYIGGGYIVGVLITSILGIVAYSHTVFSSASNISFFWEDNIRISGLFDDPVIYGAFLIPAILFLGTKAIFASQTRYYSLYTALALLVFSNLILTGARGAWLNFVIASVVLFVAYPALRSIGALRRLGAVVILALTVALTLIFAIPLNGRSYYEATLAHRYQSSDLPRIQNIQAAPQHISDRSIQSILLGSGSGSYEQTTAEGFSAHNTYLRIIYEQGIIGIGIYCTFLIFALRRIYIRRSAQPLFAAIICASFVGVLVHGLFVDTLHWRHFWVLAGLIV